MNRITEQLWNVAMLTGLIWLFTQSEVVGWVCFIAVAVTVVLPLPDSHFRGRR